MDIASLFNQYKKLLIILVLLYVAICTLYYFFGYGYIGPIQEGTSAYVNNAQQTPKNKKIKLRPGSYQLYAATPTNTFSNKITVLPFITKPITLTPTNYAVEIENSFSGSKTYKATAVKLLNNKWLVGKLENSENSVIVVLQFNDGKWTQVSAYSLPEENKTIDKTYFDILTPKYVSDYIKQVLLR